MRGRRSSGVGFPAAVAILAILAGLMFSPVASGCGPQSGVGVQQVGD